MTNEFSIILTTYNGELSLPATLDRLKSFNIPRAGIELLLVDNASDDGTPRLLKEFAAQYGGRVLQEPTKGKSFGLNRALSEATGDYLVFIDDDVKIEANWLSAFREAVKRYPEAVVFGGQIRPDWISDPNKWQQYLTEQGRSEGCTPLHQGEGIIRPNLVKGANMMVRRSRIGNLKFDVQNSNYVGSKSSHGGEDTNFALDAAPYEGQCVFVPHAIVYHRIDPSKMTLRAVYMRYVRIGKVMGQRVSVKQPSLTTIILHLIRALSNWIMGRQGRAALILTGVAMRVGQRRTSRKG